MKLVYGLHPEISQWVSDHIPMMSGLPFYRPKAIGVVDDGGELVAGVVFHNYQPAFSAIEISCAATSRKWLTQRNAYAIMHYPFVQLGCRRITALTPPKRGASALRFLNKFGFVREGLIRHGFGSDDAAVMGLLREEWEAGPFGPRALGEQAGSPDASRSDHGRERSERV